MSGTGARALLLAGVAGLLLAGCSNPDAARQVQRRQASPRNTGELPAPSPATPAAQHPAPLQRSRLGALTAFAAEYVNWDYRTLAREQRALAASAVGPARLAEQQAASRGNADTTIARGHIWNHGSIISIAPARNDSGVWVIVTREQTGGSTEYQGLPAAYHITLAKLAQVPGGWAVSEWLPQS